MIVKKLKPIFLPKYFIAHKGQEYASFHTTKQP